MRGDGIFAHAEGHQVLHLGLPLWLVHVQRLLLWRWPLNRWVHWSRALAGTWACWTWWGSRASSWLFSHFWHRCRLSIGCPPFGLGAAGGGCSFCLCGVLGPLQQQKVLRVQVSTRNSKYCKNSPPAKMLQEFLISIKPKRRSTSYMGRFQLVHLHGCQS